jgi:hypothetical protein
MQVNGWGIGPPAYWPARWFVYRAIAPVIASTIVKVGQYSRDVYTFIHRFARK